MTKIKKIVSVLLISVFLLALTLFSVNNKTYVKADTDLPTGETETESGVELYGLFTSLTLSIDGGDGEIWANVHNDITIFPATIYVIVQLYSSDTYQESYQNMKLISANSTKDLNMGETLTTKVSTNGEQKYWKARMYYRMDAKDWVEKVTKTLLFSADGMYLM